MKKITKEMIDYKWTILSNLGMMTGGILIMAYMLITIKVLNEIYFHDPILKLPFLIIIAGSTLWLIKNTDLTSTRIVFKKKRGNVK